MSKKGIDWHRLAEQNTTEQDKEGIDTQQADRTALRFALAGGVWMDLHALEVVLEQYRYGINKKEVFLLNQCLGVECARSYSYSGSDVNLVYENLGWDNKEVWGKVHVQKESNVCVCVICKIHNKIYSYQFMIFITS